MNIILASKSPRRKELLEKMGYSFQIISKETPEVLDEELSVEDNILNISLEKGQAVFLEHKSSLVISCDTVVVFNNKIYGKPHSKEEAYKMLKSLSNNYHYVMSAVAIMYGKKKYQFVEKSKVYFKNLSDSDISDYLSHDEYKDKAGSYAIQGIGRCLVDRYEGSLNNIIGLPTEKIREIFDEIGI